MFLNHLFTISNSYKWWNFGQYYKVSAKDGKSGDGKVLARTAKNVTTNNPTVFFL